MANTPCINPILTLLVDVDITDFTEITCTNTPGVVRKSAYRNGGLVVLENSVLLNVLLKQNVSQ